MNRLPTPVASPEEMSRIAAELFADAPALQRFLARYRPFIAPFEVLTDAVPQGARILDIGCGNGLFLGLLAARRRIAEGVGFDSNAAAISVADVMTSRLPEGHSVRFECLAAEAPWPRGPFDVVSLIDVIHHVDPPYQRMIISSAARILRPGGVLLYKDMANRPVPMAMANRLHDLVLARQWIRYLPIDEARKVIEAEGLRVEHTDVSSRFWYRHEMIVARRMGA